MLGEAPILVRHNDITLVAAPMYRRLLLFLKLFTKRPIHPVGALTRKLALRKQRNRFRITIRKFVEPLTSEAVLFPGDELVLSTSMPP
jgi:hypothetical protein